MLEVVGFFASLAAVFWGLAFLVDPEAAANRLGRCIHAFRRGLSGKTIERSEHPSALQPESKQQ